MWTSQAFWVGYIAGFGAMGLLVGVLDWWAKR